MNDDLISREALKRDLEVTQYNDIDDLLRTEQLIDNAPPVSHGEWIPVSERLPKYNKTVLISVKQIGKEARVFTAQRRKRFKTPDIFECCTDNDGWWDFRISAWDDHEVLAWMPLPEPYKEAEK